MKLVTTSVYEKLAAAWVGGKRHVWVEGGTAASKTYSTMQLLVLIARYAKGPMLISIVSESLPHLKRGTMRDLRNIMGLDWHEASWNATDHIYRFGQGVVEFFSADEPAKMRGGRRDILYINEANNVAYEAYRELDARTRLCTFADWNPVGEFWYHEQGLGSDEESTYIHATYKDALNVIPPEVVRNIEDMGARDPNWAHVYLEGLLGKIEGLVYPHFQQCEALPAGDAFYGLDFGFSDDPAVLVKNVIQGDNLYSEELIYQRGMTNQDIAARMAELGIRKGYDEIWADSAEPKSIEEIHQRGFLIKPCAKGQGSVEYGHQRVRSFNQFWTKNSLNCIKEQRNFRYIPDKDGKYTEKTMHLFSHGMDARRYGVMGKHQVQPQFFVGVAA